MKKIILISVLVVMFGASAFADECSDKLLASETTVAHLVESRNLMENQLVFFKTQKGKLDLLVKTLEEKIAVLEAASGKNGEETATSTPK